MTAATGVRSTIGPYLPFIVGPALLVAGAVVFLRSNDLATIVPLDAAELQGLLGLPLVLMSPGVVALGWRAPTGPAALRLVLLLGVGIAVLVAAMLLGSITQVGCRPITSQLDAFPQAALLGALAAMGFVLAARAARPKALGPVLALRSILVGAVVGLVALVVDVGAFLVLFPMVSCAPFV